MAVKSAMIVGTSAPRRRHLMKEAFGDEFELFFVSPDIDERQYHAQDAATLTGQIADAKMDAVLAQVAASDDAALRALASTRRSVVAVTFDQVVVWQGHIREKPADAAQAREFIRCYSNSSLATVQTTCVFMFEAEKRVLCRNETRTYYGELPDEVVERVVARGECLHTAGAFVVEDPDMHAHMIRVDPGTEVEVQGVSEQAVRDGLQQLIASLPQK